MPPSPQDGHKPPYNAKQAVSRFWAVGRLKASVSLAEKTFQLAVHLFDFLLRTARGRDCLFDLGVVDFSHNDPVGTFLRSVFLVEGIPFLLLFVLFIYVPLKSWRGSPPPDAEWNYSRGAFFPVYSTRSQPDLIC